MGEQGKAPDTPAVPGVVTAALYPYRPLFSALVMRKANNVLANPELVRSRVRKDPEVENVWWIAASRASSSGHRMYRVAMDWQPDTQMVTWCSCTCPYGLHKGGGDSRCYHVALVWEMLCRGAFEASDGKPQS